MIEKSHPFESDILCYIFVDFWGFIFIGGYFIFFINRLSVIQYKYIVLYIYKLHNYVIPHIYNTLNIISGLEPGWLGASFGLRICYVRIIITRNMISINCI